MFDIFCGNWPSWYSSSSVWRFLLVFLLLLNISAALTCILLVMLPAIRERLCDLDIRVSLGSSLTEVINVSCLSAQ